MLASRGQVSSVQFALGPKAIRPFGRYDMLERSFRDSCLRQHQKHGDCRLVDSMYLRTTDVGQCQLALFRFRKSQIRKATHNASSVSEPFASSPLSDWQHCSRLLRCGLVTQFRIPTHSRFLRVYMVGKPHIYLHYWFNHITLCHLKSSISLPVAPTVHVPEPSDNRTEESVDSTEPDGLSQSIPMPRIPAH